MVLSNRQARHTSTGMTRVQEFRSSTDSPFRRLRFVTVPICNLCEFLYQ